MFWGLRNWTTAKKIYCKPQINQPSNRIMTITHRNALKKTFTPDILRTWLNWWKNGLKYPLNILLGLCWSDSQGILSREHGLSLWMQEEGQYGPLPSDYSVCVEVKHQQSFIKISDSFSPKTDTPFLIMTSLFITKEWNVDLCKIGAIVFRFFS